MEPSKVIIITQARVGSTRFPGKVLMKVGGYTLLSIHLQRLKKSKLASAIIVATTEEDGADDIVKVADSESLNSFRGSTDDVLDRFYRAGKKYNPDYVVRVTSDCPLIDASLIDGVIRMAVENQLDYCSNGIIEEYPDGQDVEVVKWTALEKAWQEAKLLSEREHVTSYIRKNSDCCGGALYKAMHYPAPFNYNKIRMTVDEPADLLAIQTLIAKLGSDEGWMTYTHYLINHPEEFSNQEILRNEGYLKSLAKDR